MNLFKEEIKKPLFFHQKFEAAVKKQIIKVAISGCTRIGLDRGIQHEEWSYLDLNNRANNLAAVLMHEVMPKSLQFTATVPGKCIIATYLGRTMDTVMANIAIHKAGGGFLNLNTLTKFDEELQGIDHFLKCLSQPDNQGRSPFNIECILTTSDLWNDIEQALSERNIQINVDHIVFLDIAEEHLLKSNGGIKGQCHHYPRDYIDANIVQDFTPVETHPDTIAYVKFSSGTTGKPKGIIIKHRGIMARVESELAMFEEADDEVDKHFAYSSKNLESERVIQLIDHSVDASFNEMILALAYGGRLDVVDEETVGNIGRLWEFYKTNKITTTILVPNVWKALADHAITIGENFESLVNLKRVLTTGAAANIYLVTNFLSSKLPRICLNCYGPTEATYGVSTELIKQGRIEASCFDYNGRPLVSIGRPMKGTRLLIVERKEDSSKDCPSHFTVLAEIRHDEKMPEGECEGELIAVDDNLDIASIAVGYCNNPEKDKLAFIEIDGKYNTYVGEQRIGYEEICKQKPIQRWRAYRTGDKVCLKGGKLGTFGRYDRQIKINGRPPIDLEDIEALLTEAISTTLELTDEEKQRVQAKVFYRHAEYQSLADKQNKLDDHHLVAFIDVGKNVHVKDEDLISIYHYMFDKLGSNIGIPSRWSTRCTFTENNASAWKDNKRFIDKIWNTQLEDISIPNAVEGYRVLGTCDSKAAFDKGIGKELTRLWKNMLFPEMDIKIGKNTHFEMLGGNSVLAMELLAQISKEWGVPINPAEFYKHKTLGSLIDDVKKALIAHKKELVLKVTQESISPIEGVPVYLVPPPMGTEDDSYFNFRQFISRRLVISTLTPGVVNENLQSTRFSETANYHLSSIMPDHRSHKPHKPYILVGYSSGGIEAFETGRLLTEKGFQAIVILIDAPCPTLVQEMTWNSYEDYLIKKFLAKTLALTQVFKFKEGEFEVSEALRSDSDNITLAKRKLALIAELRAYLHGHSNQTTKFEIERQRNKIEVSLNHLEAELNYDMSIEVKFPCFLVTSQEFREYFSNLHFDSVEDEVRGEQVARLGWPKTWLTPWFDVQERSQNNPFAMKDVNHFALMQIPTVKYVARRVVDFIHFAERRVQTLLDISQLIKKTERLRNYEQESSQTTYKILAITSQGTYCRDQYKISINMEYNKEGNLLPIYVSYEMAKACSDSHDFFVTYFDIISKTVSNDGKEESTKINKKAIHRTMRLVVFIDHIYDITELRKIHDRIKESVKRLGSYRVDSVLYTIEPQLYPILKSVFNNEICNIDDPYRPDRLSFESLLENEKSINDKNPNKSAIDCASQVEQYIDKRLTLLEQQSPDNFIDLTRDLLMKAAMNYTENLVVMRLGTSSSEAQQHSDALDFVLLSTTLVDKQQELIEEFSKQSIYLRENKFIAAVRFCCLLKNLDVDEAKLIRHPIFDSHFRNQANLIINSAAKPEDSKADELLEEYFRPSADRRQLLIIRNFKTRLNSEIELLKKGRHIILSDSWCHNVVLLSIRSVMDGPDNVHIGMCKYLIKCLVAIQSHGKDQLQRYAASLLMSLVMQRGVSPALLIDSIKQDRFDGQFKIKDFESLISIECSNDGGTVEANSRAGGGKKIMPVSIDLAGFKLVSTESNKISRSDMKFKAINFSDSYFSKIIFEGCDFNHVNFDNCNFYGCEFINCKFKNCSFDKAKFLDGCKFVGKKTFVGCHLAETGFNSVSLSDISFLDCVLTLANFNTSSLRACSFDQCDITGITFVGSNCESVELNSYLHRRLVIQQFDGMTGKINLSSALISPNSLFDFYNDSKRFDFATGSKRQPNVALAHLTPQFLMIINKLYDPKIKLSENDDLALTSGYKKLIETLRLSERELMACWYNEKIEEYARKIEAIRIITSYFSKKMKIAKIRLNELNANTEAQDEDVGDKNDNSKNKKGESKKPTKSKEQEMHELKAKMLKYEMSLSIISPNAIKESFEKMLTTNDQDDKFRGLIEAAEIVYKNFASKLHEAKDLFEKHSKAVKYGILSMLSPASISAVSSRAVQAIQKFTKTEAEEKSDLHKEISKYETAISNLEGIKRSFTSFLDCEWKKDSEGLCGQIIFELNTIEKSKERQSLEGESVILLYRADLSRNSCAYVDVFDALAIAECANCCSLSCECDSNAKSTRRVQLIRVNKDTDVVECTLDGYNLRDTAYHLGPKTKIDIVRTLVVNPVKTHPYHAGRRKTTSLPTYYEYQKSLSTALVMLNESPYQTGSSTLEMFLKQYFKSLRPNLLPERLELLTAMKKCIEIYPLLEEQALLNLGKIEHEKQLLLLFKGICDNSAENMSCNSSTLLITARSYAVRGDKFDQAVYYYFQVKHKLLDIDPELSKEISDTKSHVQGVNQDEILSATMESKQLRGSDAIKYALVYYRSKRGVKQIERLESYKSSGLLKTGLLIDNSGNRLGAYHCADNDYLVRQIAVKPEETMGVIETGWSILSSYSQQDNSEDDHKTFGGNSATSIDLSEKEGLSEIGVRASLPNLPKTSIVKERKRAIRGEIVHATQGKPETLIVRAHIEKKLIESHAECILANTASDGEGSIIIKRTKNRAAGGKKDLNPVTPFIVMNLMQRLHGLVPNHYYVILNLFRKDTESLLLCENVEPVAIPNDSHEFVNEMGHYALTWKLFEICILGIKNDDYRISYAVKKKNVIFADNEKHFYPAYTNTPLHPRHRTIDWGAKCFSLLDGDFLSSFAIAELKFLDPEEVIYGWLSDNDRFEKKVLRKLHNEAGKLSKKLRRVDKVQEWLSEFPEIEIEIFERFRDFRQWILSHNPNTLTYAAVWKAVWSANFSRHSEHQVRDKSVMGIRKAKFQENILSKLQKRAEFKRALEHGDLAMIDTTLKDLSAYHILQILSEFDLVKLKLEHFAKLLNKVMAEGITSISLNNPTQDQIDTVQSHQAKDKIKSVEITHCKGARALNIDALPHADHVHVTDCENIEVTCSRHKTTLNMEGSSVTKFTGSAEVKLQIEEDLAVKAVVQITDDIDTVKNLAAQAQSRQESKKAYRLAEVGLAMNPADKLLRELEEIKARNFDKSYLVQLIYRKIELNDISQVIDLAVANKSNIDDVTREKIATFLINAFKEKSKVPSVQILSAILEISAPTLDLLLTVIKLNNDDFVQKIIDVKPDIVLENINNMDALSQAVIIGNSVVIQRLLDKGASLQLALIKCIETEIDDKITDLIFEDAIKRGIIENIHTENGSSLLVRAAMNRKFNIVRKLINAGVDVSTPCINGTILLEVLVELATQSQSEVTQELIEITKLVCDKYDTATTAPLVVPSSQVHTADQHVTQVEVLKKFTIQKLEAYLRHTIDRLSHKQAPQITDTDKQLFEIEDLVVALGSIISKGAAIPLEEEDLNRICKCKPTNDTTIEYDVPGDSSCFFWSVALSYLLPVVCNNDEFNRKFDRLFGSNIQDKQIFWSLLKKYHPINNFKELYKNPCVNWLIRVTLRARVLTFMLRNKEFLPLMIVEDRIYSDNAPQSLKVVDYVLDLLSPYAYGGGLEISALRKMLNCEFILYSDNNMFKDIEDKLDTKDNIILHHVRMSEKSIRPNHYHFRISNQIFGSQPIQGENKSNQNSKIEQAVSPPKPSSSGSAVLQFDHQIPGKGYDKYRYSCVSGHGKTLAVLNKHELVITNLETNEVVVIRDSFIPDIINIEMDYEGGYVLFVSPTQLMLVRTKDSKLSPKITADLGILGAAISHDGTMCVYKHRSGQDEFIEFHSDKMFDRAIKDAKVVSNSKDSRLAQLAWSDDKHYIAVAEPGKGGIWLCDYQATIVFDALLEEKTPILKLQFHKHQDAYRLCWLTENAFNMVDIMISIGEDGKEKIHYDPYFKLISDELVSKTPLISGSFETLSASLVDFAIADSGNALALLDSNNTLHGICFENDACFHREMKEYNQVLLSQSGHVVATSQNNRDRFVISTTEFTFIDRQVIQTQQKSPARSKASLFGGTSTTPCDLTESSNNEEEIIRRNDQLIREKEEFLRQLKVSPLKALELLTQKLRNQGDERAAEEFAIASEKLSKTSLLNTIESQDKRSPVAAASSVMNDNAFEHEDLENVFDL